MSLEGIEDDDGEDCSEDNLCTWCRGDAVQDAYEDDPINNAPGDLEPCSACQGTGLAKYQVIW